MTAEPAPIEPDHAEPDHAEPEADRPAARWRPHPAAGVLAVVVAGHLWLERHLLQLVSWPNDLPFHQAMVDWATGRFQAGQVPTDGWFPRLSGGLPQFHLYQSLPHVVTGLLGTAIGSERASHLALWLLVATWPVPVYLCARAFGLSAVAAAAAAVAAPLLTSVPGYGFEPFSYLWIGNGLWSQAWGMWVAPLALGWTARAVRDGTGYGRAVAAVALTVAFHLPTAWFVLVALGLWPLVRPSEWRRRLLRSAGLGALVLAASAWVLVPFVVDRWATNASSFNDQAHFSDSFGWRKVLGWLLAGDVLDAGRLPVLSAVAAVGFAAAVVRWRQARPGEREVVVLGLLSLGLFIGRNPLGPVIALLPGSSEVFLHRYVATLQLGLVLLLGIGVDAAWSWARAQPAAAARPRAAAALGVAAALVLLVAPLAGTIDLVHEDRSWVAFQASADDTTGRDAAELVALADARGGGRIFAGKLNGTGRAFTIGRVPAPIWLAHLPVDALGYTLRVSALAADLETYLDETSVADLDAFGIRYVLVPPGGRPPTGTWFLAARGGMQLWEVPGDGLVSAAHLLGPALPVDRSELAAELLPVLQAQGGSPTAVRLLDLEGRSPGAPTQDEDLDERPGTLVGTDLDLEGGRMATMARFATPGAVVVKANWNPRWHATVDGEAVPVVAVAPTWLAVPVPPGDHAVELHYRPWPWTPHLLALAAAAVAAGWWWSRSATRPVDGPPRPGRRLRSSRGRRGRTGAAAVSVLALVAACGTPHRLPDEGTAVSVRSPLAGIELRRPDSFATLDRVIAPDRRTVVVLADPDCDACAEALGPLARAASGREPFSVLVLGLPAATGVLATAAAAQNLSRWDVATPAVRAGQALGLLPAGGVVVVDPDGRIRHRWPGEPDDRDVTEIIEEATP